MSEHEKISGVANTSMVLVEQPVSRHKPIRSIDMQEDVPKEQLTHKRSKAPAVPIASNDLIDNIDGKEPKNNDRGISSEKIKHNVVKKRRDSSPESISLSQMNTETKKSGLLSPSHPIPAPKASVASAPSKFKDKLASEKKDDEDSITSEIAELQTPEVAKKSSEWDEIAEYSKKKGVSWNDGDYLDKVRVGGDSKSQSCVLERKTSIGPCFRATRPFGRPSGIALNLSTKKPLNEIIPEMVPSDKEYRPDCSVISITLSKKCLVNKTNNRRAENHNVTRDSKPAKQSFDTPKARFLGTLKQKVANMSDRIRNAFSA